LSSNEYIKLSVLNLPGYQRNFRVNKGKYGVECSSKRIGIVLKNFRMHHSKPYSLDYRRPRDAEEILTIQPVKIS
jgi:hypothetical protein